MSEKQNILDELKELSPVLYQLKQENHNPFKVPEDYFELLKMDLFASIELGFSDELGKNSFSVPENYFDNLSGNIMAAIEEEEVQSEAKKPGRVIQLNESRRTEKTTPLKWFSIAAAVAAIALLMVFLVRVQEPQIMDVPIASKQDALEYIEDNYSEFESEDLYALVDLNDENISLDLSDDLEEELEQYLDENIDDFDEFLLTNEI